MHKVILLSNDANHEQRCSRNMAQQLLHHGLARIVKFYPYTLKLKGKPYQSKGFDGEAVVLPRRPSGNLPSLAKSRQLLLEEAV